MSCPVAETTKTAEDIRRQMAQLRCQLREDFDGTAATAKELTDWKYYVKQAPWAAFGAAAVAAFIIVPRHSQVKTVDAESAKTSVNRERVGVRSKPEAAANAGLGRFLLRTAMSMAIRTAIGVATQKAAEFGAAKGTPSPNSK